MLAKPAGARRAKAAAAAAATGSALAVATLGQLLWEFDDDEVEVLQDATNLFRDCNIWVHSVDNPAISNRANGGADALGLQLLTPAPPYFFNTHGHSALLGAGAGFSNGFYVQKTAKKQKTREKL